MRRMVGLTFVLFALGCQADRGALSTAQLDELGGAEPRAVQIDGRLARLGPDARGALLESRLPVLLPADEDLLTTAVVTSGPHFVAWGAQGDGVAVSLHGTDYQWALSDLPPEPGHDVVRGQPAYVMLNEGIQMVSWTEGGIVWSVEVECETVERDPRCASDDYARAIAESLVLAGGAR